MGEIETIRDGSNSIELDKEEVGRTREDGSNEEAPFSKHSKEEFMSDSLMLWCVPFSINTFKLSNISL